MKIERNGKVLGEIMPATNGKSWVVKKDENAINEEKTNNLIMTLIEESEQKKSNPTQLRDVIEVIARARYIKIAQEYSCGTNDYRDHQQTFLIYMPNVKIEGTNVTFYNDKQSYRMELTDDFNISMWASGLAGISADTGKSLQDISIHASKIEGVKEYTYSINCVVEV